MTFVITTLLLFTPLTFSAFLSPAPLDCSKPCFSPSAVNIGPVCCKFSDRTKNPIYPYIVFWRFETLCALQHNNICNTYQPYCFPMIIPSPVCKASLIAVDV